MIGSHPLGWSPAGIGDFDHNGVSDILWYQAGTNRAETWLLSADTLGSDNTLAGNDNNNTINNTTTSTTRRARPIS